MNAIASRYAESLFDLAIEEKQVKEYATDMQTLATIFNNDPSLVQFFAHVLIEDDAKYEVVDKSFKGQLQPYVCNFLKLLIKKRRIKYIVEINNAFHKIYTDYLGIEEGILYTSFDLDKETIKNIEQAISKKEGKTIQLQVQKDSTLIGGIKIELQNRIIDGSIKNQIEIMKKELLRK